MSWIKATFSGLLLMISIIFVGYTEAKQILPVSETCSNGDLFSMYAERLIFEEAQAFCTERGGSLARISSLEEFNLAGSLVEGTEVTEFLVGIADIGEGIFTASAERFSYTDGSQQNLNFIRGNDGELPWISGEPSSVRGDEDCVLFQAPQNGFNDVGCGTEFNFLCRSQCTTEDPISVTGSPTESPTSGNEPTAGPMALEKEPLFSFEIYVAAMGSIGFAFITSIAILIKTKQTLRNVKTQVERISAILDSSQKLPVVVEI